jgi:hypothetical protein
MVGLHSPVPQPAQNTPPLTATTTALELGSQVTRTGLSAVVSPLSGELERIRPI